MGLDQDKVLALRHLAALEVKLLALVVVAALARAQLKDLDRQLAGLGLVVEQGQPPLEADPLEEATANRIYVLAWLTVHVLGKPAKVAASASALRQTVLAPGMLVEAMVTKVVRQALEVALAPGLLKVMVVLQVAQVLEQGSVSHNLVVGLPPVLALVLAKELGLLLEVKVALLLVVDQVLALEQEPYLDKEALLQEVDRVLEQALVVQLVKEALLQVQDLDQE